MEGLNQQIPEVKATTMVDDGRLYAVETEKYRTHEEAVKHRKT